MLTMLTLPLLVCFVLKMKWTCQNSFLLHDNLLVLSYHTLYDSKTQEKAVFTNWQREGIKYYKYLSP